VSETGSSKFNMHEFDSFLWKAAGSLRRYLSSEDVKNYILSFLFFKFVSDTWDLEHAAIVADRGLDSMPGCAYSPLHNVSIGTVFSEG
jgi:type I restriction-modification system DNA methylase subunit